MGFDFSKITNSKVLKGVTKAGLSGLKVTANNADTIFPTLFVISMTQKLVKFVEEVNDSLKESRKNLDADAKANETKDGKESSTEDKSKYVESAKKAGTVLQQSAQQGVLGNAAQQQAQQTNSANVENDSSVSTQDDLSL